MLKSRCGFEDLGFDDCAADHLATHYQKVLEELADKEEVLRRTVDEGYLTRVKAEMAHSLSASREKQLDWGIFHFKK